MRSYHARARRSSTGLVLLLLFLVLMSSLLVTATHPTPHPPAAPRPAVPAGPNLRAMLANTLPLPEEGNKIHSVILAGDTLTVRFAEVAPLHGGYWAQPPHQVASILLGISTLHVSCLSVILYGARWDNGQDELYFKYTYQTVSRTNWKTASARDEVALADEVRVPWWWN